jgi:hypothetical protein
MAVVEEAVVEEAVEEVVEEKVAVEVVEDLGAHQQYHHFRPTL